MILFNSFYRIVPFLSAGGKNFRQASPFPVAALCHYFFSLCQEPFEKGAALNDSVLGRKRTGQSLGCHVAEKGAKEGKLSNLTY